jgi:dienelactone hydrolase
MRAWAGAVIGVVLVLLGSVLAWRVQTSGGQVAVHDVRFPGGPGVTMSGLLYVPKTATAQHPAPAVLVSHGLINTREMQSPFAIELSRRGYVVLAMDMTGHGYSGGVIAQNGFGGPAAFSYLASQPFVDKSAIGLEGHSLGGGPVMMAARANPDGYRAIVLEGSSPSIAGFGGGGRRAGGAAPFKPRNIAVVFGQYDEFANVMWGVKRGSEAPTSKRLQALFATDQPITPGKVYGAVADGSGRMLVLPAVDHPQEHFTQAGVGGALDWFAMTMPGPRALASGDQVWLWKEVGTLTGFVGCVVLILGVFYGVTSTAAFSGLREPVTAPLDSRSGRWLLAVLLTAAIPAVLYFPVMEKGQRWFISAFDAIGRQDFALHAFPQQITNQLAVWALASGIVAFALSFLPGRRKQIMSNRWAPALIAAVISVGAGYLALVVVSAAFKVDFRFWVLGLKPLDLPHLWYFLGYLPFFLVFFVLSARAYAISMPVKGESLLGAMLTAAVASALGFIVMLAIQYGSMLSTGLLFHDNALLTIVAFQFVPLLMVIGAVLAFTWRRTNGYAAGALICAFFITWYIVAGTATYPPTPPRPAAPPATTPPPAKAP